MKKRIVPFIVAAVLVLALPISVFSIGFALPSQFDESFYGEVAVMYHRLQQASRRKIVIIGNSAVAFGVRSDLLQQELPGYEAVNFGVYGAVGTKAMLQWSKSTIKDGDVVIVMPEPYTQTSSLYFSGKDAWRVADSDLSLAFSLSYDDRKVMLGSFSDFVGEKYQSFASGEKPSADGAYNRKAFEQENGKNEGYMVYERPYNVMGGGYDAANLPLLDPSVFGSGFLSYLNDYAKEMKGKGATVYYGFCPINSLSVSEDGREKTDHFYDYLSHELTFPLIGHPYKYIIDYRYFYDNNVHMNSSGAYIFTDLLCEDIKLALGVHHGNNISLPEPPEMPNGEIGDGDNSDAAMFTYEVKEGATEKYVRVTGLTEEGKNRNSLTLPSDYDGVPVREFAPSTFAGNTSISRLVLPSNIQTIYDHSFEGCSRLSELIFRHDSIRGINVGLDYLVGADKCYIYIKKSVSVADCAGGWERYQSRIRYY